MPELSRENLEKQPIPSEEESLYMKKSIEIEDEIIKDLIEEDGIKENDEEQAKEWIEKYGEDFREIIEKPYIAKLLKTDIEKAKQKIKEKLYKEKIH